MQGNGGARLTQQEADGMLWVLTVRVLEPASGDPYVGTSPDLREAEGVEPSEQGPRFGGKTPVEVRGRGRGAVSAAWPTWRVVRSMTATSRSGNT